MPQPKDKDWLNGYKIRPLYMLSSRNPESPQKDKPKVKLTKLTKIKNKEQILKAAREKQQITHKGIPIW